MVVEASLLGEHEKEWARSLGALFRRRARRLDELLLTRERNSATVTYTTGGILDMEHEQARTFCADYFGTSDVSFGGEAFVDTLAGYLKRVKAEQLRQLAKDGNITAGALASRVGEQLELFKDQGVVL